MTDTLHATKAGAGFDPVPPIARELGLPTEGVRAVVRLLAETFGVPRTSVTLVSGHGARDKIVDVAGVERGDIERRLAFAAGNERPA